MISFFSLQVEKIVEESCFLEKPCVRFCCKDEKNCNQKFIDNHFNASLLPDDKESGWNGSQGVKAYFGKPKCYLEPTKQKFDFVLVN